MGEIAEAGFACKFVCRRPRTLNYDPCVILLFLRREREREREREGEKERIIINYYPYVPVRKICSVSSHSR